MNSTLKIIIIFLLFNSCAEDKEKFDYHQFRKQVTPSGKYIIYQYARHGGMSFSSDIEGTEVFKSNQLFEEGKGHRIEGEISQWLTNDTLIVYNTFPNQKQPKDTLPIKTEFSAVGDFIVKTVYYTPNSFGRGIYTFDSVKTTDTSIIIRVLVNKNKKSFLSFPLGGVTIKTKNDSIFNITVAARLTKSMNFIYKNPDGTFTSGLPEIGTIWYELTPIKKIQYQQPLHYKIFWEN